jgi:hypothetical protein
VQVTFGSKRIKPIKLRQHIKNQAINLSEINGKEYRYNRMALIDAYCDKGFDGIKDYIVMEMVNARFQTPAKEELNWIQKFKLWIYGSLRR